MAFRSNADEIKYYLRGALADCREHHVSELFDVVMASENSSRFSKSMFAGALKTLVDNSNGEYSVVRRGIYKKNPDGVPAEDTSQVEYPSMTNPNVTVPEAYRAEITRIINEAISKVKTAFKGDLFDLEDDDLAEVRALRKKTLDSLTEIIN